MEVFFATVLVIGSFISMFWMFGWLDRHFTEVATKPAPQPNEDDPDFMAYLERRQRKQHPES